MTYHYNITQYRSLKEMRLWTDRIFLTLLLLTLSAIVYYNSDTLNVLLAFPAMALIIAILMVISRRRKVSFIEISNGTLSYLDTAKGEMVKVPVNDITHISTRFCQLNVHTPENTHSLNLELIRNEKTRWEIKEMIREIARQAPKTGNHPKAVA